MQSLTPEFFMLLGIDLCLATSLLTCVLDKYFPDKLCYLYQLLGLAGFGQLLVTREFMAQFADYMRFWYSFIYLLIAVANIVGLNLYLLVCKKKRTIAKLFSVIATAPATTMSALFLSNYAAEAPHPIIPLPQLPLELLFISVFTFDITVVGVSVYALLKPKWWQVVVPSAALIAGGVAFVSMKPLVGTVPFIAGSVYVYIVLGVACFGVLGASVYVLLRLWLESKKKEVT